jgi:hypothetical protein
MTFHSPYTRSPTKSLAMYMICPAQLMRDCITADNLTCIFTHIYMFLPGVQNIEKQKNNTVRTIPKIKYQYRRKRPNIQYMTGHFPGLLQAGLN